MEGEEEEGDRDNLGKDEDEEGDMDEEEETDMDEEEQGDMDEDEEEQGDMDEDEEEQGDGDNMGMKEEVVDDKDKVMVLALYL